MLDRVSVGNLPAKPHLVLRGPEGQMRYEECLTRQGFEGPFSILYHEHRPHEQRLSSNQGYGFAVAERAPLGPLAKRHYRSFDLPPAEASPVSARVPLLFNDDVVIGIVKSNQSDPVYFVNADADELFYIQQGTGILKSAFGTLEFQQGDYVCVPRGVLHRFLPAAHAEQFWLSLECFGQLSLVKHWRNEVGQLRMDAPYSHRDFRRPEFTGPEDEGIRTLVVKREGRFHTFESSHSPLDVVGYDGTVYPFAFPILNFQPKVSSVHLPPSVHGTFETRGALICSFVPRIVDFHPEAVPCPYPHSSVDIDEVLFYASGQFGSRRGIAAGSISHHPAGIPHGPHPGAYEKSLGTGATEELAVMLDCSRPLHPTPQAAKIEDSGYHESFRAD